MEAFADESVNEITVICSAQSAKTLTILALVMWVIAEDPGPILWVTSNIEEAKKLSKSRLTPLMERCAPVAARMPIGKMKTTREIYFAGSPFIITGAESPTSLQSTPFRYVILDEARSYPEGALEMVSKRFRSYTHNYKKIIITTPALEGDAVHRAFMDGDQRRWLVPCPACGLAHEMEWGDNKSEGGLKWDTNAETYDADKGLYRFDALEKTIRYKCWNPECAHVWLDVMEDRKYISTSGDWQVNNPNAPSNVRSYTWNALLPYWVSWKSQVREWLLAKKALEWSDYHPLKDHITETRGQPWADKLRFANDDKYLAERVEEYDPCEPWPFEKRRLMAVDVQGAGGRHFYYVIRSCGSMGKSRLLAYGKAWSWDEIKAKSEEWQVVPDNVLVDSGKWAPEVYEKVVESGYRWKPMKGDDKDGFRISGKTWLFQKSLADPAIGTALAGKVRPLELYVWAKYGVIERMFAFIHGVMGEWKIFPDTHEDYNLQVTTWDRRSRVGRNGVETLEWYQKRKVDHYSDCEQMIIVGMAATGLLHAPVENELPLEP